MRSNFLFKIEGAVQRGDREGSKLGFPTANIGTAQSVPSGIYAGEATWKGTVYPAAIYKEDGRNVVEAHLIDFSGELYGEQLIVVAYKKIREVKKFKNTEELIAAITSDVKKIKQWWFLSRDLHAARGDRN
ncbi:MAG: riboflavin kinase [Minisyncoccia bacterium]|jgi:riboflavin kinase/FMN adenylyltransferase